MGAVGHYSENEIMKFSDYAETLIKRKDKLILIINRISYIFSSHDQSMHFPLQTVSQKFDMGYAIS